MAKVLALTAKQAEATRTANDNTITLYGGAIRGGKTYWLILMIWVYAIRYPRSRWIILRASVPTLTQTTLVTFQSLLNEGLQQDVAHWNAQTKTCTLHNNSQIIFMAESYDTDKELNRFRGLEINGAGIDEINEIQENTLNKIIERAGSWQHSKGCPIKILATCNPTNNWVKTLFYDRYINGTLPSKWAYVPAKITDNPYLSATYVEALKQLPRYQYMVFVEGNWEVQIKTGGEFYKSFDLDKHIGPAKYNPSLPLHISFDDNVNPYLPLGIFQIVGKSILFIDEIAGRDPINTVTGVCREFVRRYPAHSAGLFVYGDATASKQDTKLEKGYNFYRLITDALKDYRPALRVLTSNPAVVMRGNFINTVLEKHYGGITLVIDPACKTAINDFVGVKEASDGTKNKEMATDPATKVRYQVYGHFTDLFDYFICSAFASEYLDYQRGGSPAVRTFGKNVSKNSY